MPLFAKSRVTALLPPKLKLTKSVPLPPSIKSSSSFPLFPFGKSVSSPSPPIKTLEPLVPLIVSFPLPPIAPSIDINVSVPYPVPIETGVVTPRSIYFYLIGIQIL